MQSQATFPVNAVMQKPKASKKKQKESVEMVNVRSSPKTISECRSDTRKQSPALTSETSLCANGNAFETSKDARQKKSGEKDKKPRARKSSGQGALPQIAKRDKRQKADRQRAAVGGLCDSSTSSSCDREPKRSPREMRRERPSSRRGSGTSSERGTQTSVAPVRPVIKRPAAGASPVPAGTRSGSSGLFHASTANAHRRITHVEPIQVKPAATLRKQSSVLTLESLHSESSESHGAGDGCANAAFNAVANRATYRDAEIGCVTQPRGSEAKQLQITPRNIRRSSNSSDDDDDDDDSEDDNGSEDEGKRSSGDDVYEETPAMGVQRRKRSKAVTAKVSERSDVSSGNSLTSGHSFQPSIRRKSSTASFGDVCRICHCEGEEENGLITPCHCTGSLRFVHQSCLQQWIKSSDTRCCELCKYDFIMESKLKPLRKWEKLQMTTSERRKIICSVTFHIIAITCVVWSLYVLIDRTAEEIRHGQENGILEWPFWTKLIVVAIGFTGGLVFMYVQCKVYVQLWRRLKAYNRVIFVQNCPDTARKKSPDDRTIALFERAGSELKEPATVVYQSETSLQGPRAEGLPM
ncbi:uncharacterized protein LOC116940240 isoform X1 [Petromyzon marinus]|uniref:uncharacterized protein LOC116940240 isoform X1 n=1 Tax=Petromyzon marinus TaxID=7757 RepID=UPI003F70DAAB